MILSRTSFEYKGINLIEKMTIRLPFRYEAIFQDEGCFLFIRNDDAKHNDATIYAQSERLELESQDAVLLKCGTYFMDWVNNNQAQEVEVIAIHLYTDVIKTLYKNDIPKSFNQIKKAQQISPVVANAILEKFIDNLEFYFEHPQLVNDDTLELKIRELILLLIQSRNGISLHQLLSGIFSESASAISDVVHTHLYSNLSIEDMAKLAGLSLSTFKRMFKKHYGIAPKQYLVQERINKAKKLLRSSNLSIKEVAYDVGFNDPSYFTRVFKLKEGVSPRDYQDGLT